LGSIPETPRNRLSKGAEGLGLAALAGLAVFFVAASWRKWPDPLIDFSRELYVPWRLSGGALLYRDVAEIFGPLSQYFNAGLFALFGPGLMVLVAANLVLFAGILALVYVLFRRAWGPVAALTAAAVFVSVFGFSQFLTIGNYNYATPYCHEATHGVLVCLLLVVVLSRWIEDAAPPRSLLAGGLFGLTALLKPEILMAGGLLTAAAVAIRLLRGREVSLRAASAWAAGAVLPTGLFAAYFATVVPWGRATAMACSAWLSVARGAGPVRELVQVRFLGLDQPWPHLTQHAAATLEALAALAGLAGLAWIADRTPGRLLRLPLGAAMAGGALLLGSRVVAWIEIGHCLLGLTLAYVVLGAVRLLRGARAPAPVQPLRLLIAILAAALMGRMLLAGRIYHYGFYQAALAGILVPAVLVGELPEVLGLGRWGRGLLTAGTLLLVGSGVVILAGRSLHSLGPKTAAVGRGRDLFYTLPPEVNPTGEVVEIISAWLAGKTAGQTLVVLPEGEMINYLARLRSPVAPFAFFGATLGDGGEARVVEALKTHPPDWIVVISRDLKDYGIRSYGERPGSGRDILLWVAVHYAVVLSVGGNPLDPRECGGVILKRNR
jgi:hypothetical protein